MKAITSCFKCCCRGHTVICCICIYSDIKRSCAIWKKIIKKYIQFATHQWIQSTTKVCNERIFRGLLFTSNKIFLWEAFLKFIALTFTLILAPFTPNWSTIQTAISLWWPLGNRYFAAFEAKMAQKSKYHESSRTLFSSSYWTILTQKVPKEA